MTDKKKNGWIKFVPSLDLPKERVSIAYATHDERGVRYAYGYFQFYNGTCGCFWKDGNEQPKVVKAEDIKYWMPVPSLDVQEEPVSEDLCEYINKLSKQFPEVSFAKLSRIAVRVAKWQKEQIMKDAVDGWVFRDIKEGKLRISDNKECWNGIRIPEKSIEKSYLFCTTDDAIKVKLVIVKED